MRDFFNANQVIIYYNVAKFNLSFNNKSTKSILIIVSVFFLLPFIY